MAKENSGWGYDRIDGALDNLFRPNGGKCPAALRHPAGSSTRRDGRWPEFIRAHKAVLPATDFFTVEVVTPCGLVTYYMLFMIHLESCRVTRAVAAEYPNVRWMQQLARNITMEEWGCLNGLRYHPS